MITAALFDLDGTLVDNMAFHGQAWLETAARLGVTTDAAYFTRELAGKTNAEIFPLLLGREVNAAELERLSQVKEERYRSLFKPHLRAIAGAKELLARLRTAGVPTAIATAAPRENQDFVLDGLGLRPLVDAVVGPGPGLRGKPYPDLFLAAARAVGADPSGAIAFEDAVNGVRAARSAQMEVVALTTGTPEAALREAGARWVLPDLRGLPEELEARLFA